MRRTAVATVTLLLLGACSSAESVTAPTPTDTGQLRQVGVDADMAALIGQIERFWVGSAPELGLDYEPVDPERIIPRSVIEERRVPCTFLGEPDTFDVRDVEDNAFVTYCDEGLSVVYDDVDFLPELRRRFGEAGTAMLMAHEWGHVIQDQLGLFDQSSLIAEQQADCYSGAYAAWAEAEGVDPFTDRSALDLAIISTLETRDAIGSAPDDPLSHGNGFDRVRATQEGYDRGVQFCAGYDETPPPITQMPFTTAIDRNNSGNLPFDRADELLSVEVADYFESLSAESLEAYVELPPTDVLRDLHAAIGDNAVGTEYALRYSEALQVAEGLDTGGEGPALQRACLVGSWLFDVIANGLEDGTSVLSPFDLDESIQTLSTSDELLANPGLVFEMVAALRVGTLEGLAACNL